MTIRHINVKINILKPKTNKELTKISSLFTVVVKEHVYVIIINNNKSFL